jgi:hypothetical protein
VDETGRIVREAKMASEPDALLAVLKKRRVPVRLCPKLCPENPGEPVAI